MHRTASGPRAVLAMLAAVALTGCVTQGPPGPPSPVAGNLGASMGAIGLGTHVAAGAMVSDTELRRVVNDTGSPVTLERISPVRLSPGLTWLGATVYHGPPSLFHHIPGFPPDDPSVTTEPVAGYELPAGGRFDLALGVRVDGRGVQGFDGLRVDYRIGDQALSSVLGYRSVLCPEAMTGGCEVDQVVPGLDDPPPS